MSWCFYLNETIFLGNSWTFYWNLSILVKWSFFVWVDSVEKKFCDYICVRIRTWVMFCSVYVFIWSSAELFQRSWSCVFCCADRKKWLWFWLKQGLVTFSRPTISRYNASLFSRLISVVSFFKSDPWWLRRFVLAEMLSSYQIKFQDRDHESKYWLQLKYIVNIKPV